MCGWLKVAFGIFFLGKLAVGIFWLAACIDFYNVTSDVITSHGMCHDDATSCVMSSQKHIKGQHAFLSWSVSCRPSCWAHIESFWCPSAWSGISWLSLQSISVLLSFVHWGLLCKQHCYISIEPTVLECCVFCKHSSVPNWYSPFSDRNISPKISRAANSRPLVRIIQRPRGVCLIRYDKYFKLFIHP